MKILKSREEKDTVAKDLGTWRIGTVVSSRGGDSQQVQTFSYKINTWDVMYNMIKIIYSALCCI